MIRCCLLLPSIGPSQPSINFMVGVLQELREASYYEKCSCGLFSYNESNFNDFVNAAKDIGVGHRLVQLARNSVKGWTKIDASTNPVDELKSHSGDNLFVLDLRADSPNSTELGVSFISDTAPIWQFESQQKTGLIIDRNYGKHGENGRGNWPGESVLLCSFDDAERKLPYSLAEKQSLSNRSWIRDDTFQQILVYYYENGPGNLYHAFHSNADKELQKIPGGIQKLMNAYAHL